MKDTVNKLLLPLNLFFNRRIVVPLAQWLDSFLFHWRITIPWKDPGKTFHRAHSACFLVYDRTKAQFRNPIGFWQRRAGRNWFRVYYSADGIVLGHKLQKKKSFFVRTESVERIYSAEEWQSLNAPTEESESSFTDTFANADQFLMQSVGLTKDVDILLWEVRIRYQEMQTEGDIHYYYKNLDYIVEYLEHGTIKGLVVNGRNISKEKSFGLSHYVKKYRNHTGLYMGYDEFFRNKIRVRLRLNYNEDMVLTTSVQSQVQNNQRQLIEVSHFDHEGRKVSSELYEGEKLQKSARFLYNEDSKLIHIIQYGPDGKILNG